MSSDPGLTKQGSELLVKVHPSVPWVKKILMDRFSFVAKEKKEGRLTVHVSLDTLWP